RAAVEALPEKMRYVITRVYLQDVSVKELAEELGITHSAVSQQRAEAIRLLRDGLNAHYADSSNPTPPVHSRVSTVSRDAYFARLSDQLSELPRVRLHMAVSNLAAN